MVALKEEHVNQQLLEVSQVQPSGGALLLEMTDALYLELGWVLIGIFTFSWPMAGGACPVCCEFGRTGTHVLRQINAEEAVYVCNHSQCPFPVGVSDQVIQNPVPELRTNSDHPRGNGMLCY